VPAGGRLRVDLPGGGGFGQADQRDPSRLAHDLSNGLVANDPGSSHTNRRLKQAP
jgi:N-methylhydantoinase B/oxoprolinase/acetone carboxylase alpha subunit